MTNKTILTLIQCSAACAHLFSAQITDSQISEARTRYANLCKHHASRSKDHKANELNNFIANHLRTEFSETKISGDVSSFSPIATAQQAPLNVGMMSKGDLNIVLEQLSIIVENPIGFDIISRLNKHKFTLLVGEARNHQSFFCPLSEQVCVIALDSNALKGASASSLVAKNGSVKITQSSADDVLIHEMLHLLHFLENDLKQSDNFKFSEVIEFFEALDSDILAALYSNDEEFMTCFGISSKGIDLASRASYLFFKYNAINIGHNEFSADLSFWLSDTKASIEHVSAVFQIPVEELKQCDNLQEMIEQVSNVKEDFKACIKGVLKKLMTVLKIFSN